MISLSGSGLQGALVATPSPLAFGTVYAGSTSTRTLTLENVGTAANHHRSFRDGSFAAEFQVASAYKVRGRPGSTAG